MGAPSAAELERAAPGLAARARALLDRHAQPYTFSRTAAIEAIEGGEVRIEGGGVLRGPGLARRLSEVRAHALSAIAWTAGAAIDEETARLWNDGCLDDAYALAAAASALVEAMRGQGCAYPREDGVAALPPYSPGYDGWPLEEQPVLYRWLADAGGSGFTARIACLPSGMLVPKKSQLAVIGLTRHPGPAASRALPCQGCSHSACQFRRAAFGFPLKALERWSRERLTLERRGDGSILARFRMDGSTCRNIPVAVHFEVELENSLFGRLIGRGDCRPAAGDRGCASMCCAWDRPVARVFQEIAAAQPLRGAPLEDALTWNPEVNPAGCVCTAAMRDHKWRLVYQTIAFALEKI